LGRVTVIQDAKKLLQERRRELREELRRVESALKALGR
jgi:hypothetical protein